MVLFALRVQSVVDEDGGDFATNATRLRHEKSADGTPASAFLRMPMICSAEYRCCLTGISLGHLHGRRLQAQGGTDPAITSGSAIPSRGVPQGVGA